MRNAKQFGLKGRGRIKRVPGTMNKTEARYAEHLQMLLLAGEIAAYGFEVVSLKLADKTRYTPDFFVLAADGAVEFHEVKGCRSDGKPLFEDASKIKVKVAAEVHWMFVFKGAYALPKKLGGGWKHEDFSSTPAAITATG